jgi:hypothetical protein
MFVVTEAAAAAIRAAFEQRGELSAAVELRRLFPGMTDTAQARACARTFGGAIRRHAAPSVLGMIDACIRVSLPRATG